MANEDRLISTKRAMDFLRESKVNDTGAFSKGINKGLNIALSALGNNQITPTVDAVEVVRCKDCKHTRKKNGHEQFMYNENVCICTKEDIWGITKNEPVWDDGYCSYGERKTDGSA